jgi:hypothetical protein
LPTKPVTPGVLRTTPQEEVHAHQHVAGELVLADGLAVAVLDLDDLFLGHLGLVDVVLDVERDGALLQVGLHPVLVARVGVDDVPLAGGEPELLAEGGDRVDLDLVRLGDLGVGLLERLDGRGLLVGDDGHRGLLGGDAGELVGGQDLVLLAVGVVDDLLGGVVSLGPRRRVLLRSVDRLDGFIGLGGLGGVVRVGLRHVGCFFLEMTARRINDTDSTVAERPDSGGQGRPGGGTQRPTGGVPVGPRRLRIRRRRWWRAWRSRCRGRTPAP